MTIPIPPAVSSTNDLTGLILEVREYAKWFNQYANAAKLHASYKQAQPELSPTASTLIRDWAKQAQLTSVRIDELIAGLEHTKAHAPVMTVTLAAPATSEVKKALVAWCRTNISADILVTFRFNSGLLGGMVVRYGSSIYDWSFRRTIMNERHKFAEILSCV